MTHDEAIYKLAWFVRGLCIEPHYVREQIGVMDAVIEALRPAPDAPAKTPRPALCICQSVGAPGIYRDGCQYCRPYAAELERGLAHVGAEPDGAGERCAKCGMPGPPHTGCLKRERCDGSGFIPTGYAYPSTRSCPGCAACKPEPAPTVAGDLVLDSPRCPECDGDTYTTGPVRYCARCEWKRKESRR